MRRLERWIVTAALLLFLAGVLLVSALSAPAQAQTFVTNTPRPAFHMSMPTQFAPSATAASLTLTARAQPSALPSPTPAPPHVAPLVAREISSGGRVIVCILCVVVD